MKVLKLDDEMPFGKHKGKQVEDLVEDEPSYIRWLVENANTEFDNETLEALEKREARR